jgi:hypothetical protein
MDSIQRTRSVINHESTMSVIKITRGSVAKRGASVSNQMC